MFILARMIAFLPTCPLNLTRSLPIQTIAPSFPKIYDRSFHSH
ncbi:MAG: hypothetical protein ACO31I_08835 [Prochlorotrichaceae cyanobacterium]